MIQYRIVILDLTNSGPALKAYEGFLKRSLFHRFQVMRVEAPERNGHDLLRRLAQLRRNGVRLAVPVASGADTRLLSHIDTAVKAAGMSTPYAVVAVDLQIGPMNGCPSPLVSISDLKKTQHHRPTHAQAPVWRSIISPLACGVFPGSPGHVRGWKQEHPGVEAEDPSRRQR